MITLLLERKRSATCAPVMAVASALACHLWHAGLRRLHSMTGNGMQGNQPAANISKLLIALGHTFVRAL